MNNLWCTNYSSVRTNTRFTVAKLQMHENLYKNVNENMFSFIFLCKFSQVFFEVQSKQQMLYTANILSVF